MEYNHFRAPQASIQFMIRFIYMIHPCSDLQTLKTQASMYTHLKKNLTYKIKKVYKHLFIVSGETNG